MAKAQKTKGASFWTGKIISTTDNQKTEIIDSILGIDLDDDENHKIAEEIMGKIRVIIGSYEGAVESIDKKPRPANYLAELDGTKKNKDGTLKDGLRRQAFDLSESISNMSYWMEAEFQEQNYNLHEFHLQLAGFFDVCNKIRQKHEDMPSPGRPKESAKRMVTNYLNAVFEKYYSTPPLDDNDDERDGRHNAKERDRIKFLRYCMAIDNIPCPETDSALINLLYNENDSPEEKLGFRTF
ncbi:MAG: hypothetical protein EOM21_17820 [Gammaproteobacteria bacterium]|nr:hypothetical protein [Gammaproteobacteria bacterium]